MNFRQIGEFSALVSANSRCVIEGSAPISEAALREFWQLSRMHLGSRNSFLRKSASEMEYASESIRSETWNCAEKILAEIFGIEMLMRVWCTVLIAADRRHGSHHSEPVVRSVMSGQQQSRNLSLSLMVNWSRERDPRLSALDRIRRRAERWTDVLIGHIAVRHGVTQFAFDKRRALDFGMDQLSEREFEPECPVWKLITSGLRISFPDATSPRLSHDAWHQQIVRSVLAAFPDELSRSKGPFAAFLSDEYAIAGQPGC